MAAHFMFIVLETLDRGVPFSNITTQIKNNKMKLLIKTLLVAGFLSFTASQSSAITVGLLGGSSGNAAGNLNQLVTDGDITSWANVSTATFNAATVASLASSYDVLVVGWAGDGSQNLDWATRVSALLSAGVGIIFEAPANLGDITGVASGLTFGGGATGAYNTLAGPFTTGINNSYINDHFSIATYSSSWTPFLLGGTATLGVYRTDLGGRMIVQGPDMFYHGDKFGGGADTNQYNLARQEILWAAADTASVPDGGSTIALLGLSLVGVAGLRRKFGI